MTKKEKLQAIKTMIEIQLMLGAAVLGVGVGFAFVFKALGIS